MGILLCCLSALLYGLNAVLIKFASQELSIAQILFWRGIFAVLILTVPMRRQKIPALPTDGHRITLLAVHTFFGFILTTVLLNSAYFYLPVGAVTTIHYLYPLLVYLGGALVWKAPFSWKVMPILLAVLAGSALLTESSELSGGGLGILLALASSVTWAFHMLFLERTPLCTEPPLRLSFWQGSMSGLVGLFLLLNGGAFFSVPDSFSLFILLLSALFTLIGAGVLLSLGIRRIGSAPAAVLSVFEPVGSLLFGWLFLREMPTLRQWSGILVILCAVLVLMLMKNTKALGGSSKM